VSRSPTVVRCRLTLSKPVLKAPGTKRLRLFYDGPPSNFAFKSNLRRYATGSTRDLFAPSSPKSPSPTSPSSSTFHQSEWADGPRTASRTRMCSRDGAYSPNTVIRAGGVIIVPKGGHTNKIRDTSLSGGQLREAAGLLRALTPPMLNPFLLLLLFLRASVSAFTFNVTYAPNAGGSLGTSTPPMWNLIHFGVLLLTYVCAFTLNVSHVPTSIECLLSVTRLPMHPEGMP